MRQSKAASIIHDCVSCLPDRFFELISDLLTEEIKSVPETVELDSFPLWKFSEHTTLEMKVEVCRVSPDAGGGSLSSQDPRRGLDSAEEESP